MIAPNSPVGPESQSDGEPPLTMAVLLRRCSDDVNFALHLLRMFERQLPTLADAVERAVAAGVAGDIARAAHAFRGVASTMGAATLAAVCQRIEAAAGDDAVSDLMPEFRSEVDRCALYTPQAVSGLASAA